MQSEKTEQSWEVDRHGWVASVILVAAGLICDADSAYVLRDALLLGAFGVAAVFLYRCLRLRDVRGAVVNGLALGLATLGVIYVFVHRFIGG